MLLKRRTKRRLLVIGMVLLVAFVLSVAGAGAWGFGHNGYSWPPPISWFL